jgi:hypothetical protein
LRNKKAFDCPLGSAKNSTKTPRKTDGRRMVEDPADYRWSSYGEAIGGRVKGCRLTRLGAEAQGWRTGAEGQRQRCKGRALKHERPAGEGVSYTVMGEHLWEKLPAGTFVEGRSKGRKGLSIRVARTKVPGAAGAVDDGSVC